MRREKANQASVTPISDLLHAAPVAADRRISAMEPQVAYYEMREHPVVRQDVISELRASVERLADVQARLRFAMREISGQIQRKS